MAPGLVYDEPMRCAVLTRLLALPALALAVAAGCTTGPSTFDPDVNPDPDVDFITDEDIGTSCVYDPQNQENPTNQCASGLTCLIYTRDALYTPFPSTDANAPVFISVFEDHLTTYRDDGRDEGYCTLVYNNAAPNQVCPEGTYLRQFQGGFTACMKLCQDNNGCRDDQVCGFRYLDLSLTNASGQALGHCVRPCEADAPDCIRAGWIPTEANPQVLDFRLALEDLLGGSICNEANGLCLPNPTNGDVPPGGACQETEECAGTLCLGDKYLGLPQGAGGFCAGVCQPDAMDPFAACSAPGYACQEGLKLGQEPFNTRILAPDVTEGYDNTFGGWCFPACMTDPSECAGIEGTSCGQPDANGFQAQWNGISMCMIPSLLAGN